MASTDARPVVLRSTAYRHYFALRKSDGSIIPNWTGADTEVSKDGGSFADATNEATEIGSSGCGYIDLTSSETDADALVVKVTFTNTGALPLLFVFFPQESSDRAPLVSETQAGLATAAALDTVDNFLDTEIGAIKAKTDLIPTDPATETTLATLATAAAVDALPTNAELATALAGADDAVLSAVAALNDLDAAGIRAAIGMAAADLDDQLDAIDTAAGGGLDAAGVRAAIGMASANLDAQLGTIDDFLDTEIAAIKARTDLIPASPATEGTLATLATAANLATVDSIVDAILLDTASLDARVPASPAAVSDVPTADEIALATLDLDDAVETDLTLRQALRLIAAASAGILSGAATTTVTIRNVGNTKARITATVDGEGNRTAISTDVS